MSWLPDPGSRGLRYLRPGGNPLVRTSDRLEVISGVASLVALLLAVPIALAVFTVVRADRSAVARDEAATRHQETAVLLADAAVNVDRAAPWPVRTPAVWTVPGGADNVHGDVLAPAGAQAGDSVDIWIDDAGRLTARPLDGTAVMTESVMAGIQTFLLLAAVTASGHLLIGRLLWRHRARRWEADWEAVEPRWAGRAEH